jgi:hypothetical protein
LLLLIRLTSLYPFWRRCVLYRIYAIGEVSIGEEY